jgi:hypothetical protein
MDTAAVKSGESFRMQITNKFNASYKIKFSSEDLPTVSIPYQLSDGTKKTAKFELDGYNDNANIGYKLVLAEDKILWDERIGNGDLEAPDMSDELIIQSACLQYDFPVIFLSAYQYQNDSGNKALEDMDKFIDSLNKIMKSDEIKKWESGLQEVTS